MFTPKIAWSAVLLLAFALPARPAPAGESAKLAPLRTDLAAFLAKQPGSAAESRRLAGWLGQAEFVAGHEQEEAERAGLLAEIAGLRGRLAAAAPGRAAAAAAIEGGPTATLVGRVSATAGDAAISNAALTLYDVAGYFAGSTYSDVNGRYVLPDLPPSTYKLMVSSYYPSYGAELWADIPCPYANCPFELGTPIPLAAGQTFTADFQLDSFAEIEGTVRAREDGQPLPNSWVQLFSGAGYSGISAFTDEAGHYRLEGLEAGTYYVAVTDSADRPGMLYDGNVCQLSPYDYYLACDLTGAELLEVERGRTISGIDFSIARGALVRGRVTDAVTGLPLSNAAVHLQDLDSTRRRTVNVGDGGLFVFAALKSGRWQATVEAAGHTPQAYHLHDCAAADHCTAGFDPVLTVQGQAREGVDFALVTSGTATGRVVDQITRRPVVGAYVTSYSPDGYPVGAANTDTAGFFSIPNLPAGEVVFLAEATGYRPEYYEDVDYFAGPGAAKRVTIRPSEVTSGIEISPPPLGNISGRAVDAASGAPILSCLVTARLLDGPAPASDWTAACGDEGRFTLVGLWPGNYRLWVHPLDGHAPYLYGIGSCNLSGSYPQEPVCDLGGPPVPVASGATTQLDDFRLDAGAGIFGSVSIAISPGGLDPTPWVRLYDAAGRQVVSQAIYQSEQNYGFTALAPGTYHLVLDGAGAWTSEAWNGVACSRWYCDPKSGQPVPLQAGDQRAGFDFDGERLAPYTGCADSPTALCLQQGRFKVETTWHDFIGQSGPGKAVRVTDETAYFWFFNPDNVELMVKALNACTPELGLHFWIFAAGLTNVQVEMKVTDTLTGAVKTYGNPSGQVIAPVLDIGAFASCRVVEPAAAASSATFIPPPLALAAIDPGASAPPAASAGASCVDTPSQLCLADGRFQVGATFRRNAQDDRFTAEARRLTGDTAAFTFFNPSNVELMVKVLDACNQGLPGYWVFAAGLTDLEVEIVVKDTLTGSAHTYRNELGPFRSIFDLGTFASSCN